MHHAHCPLIGEDVVVVLDLEGNLKNVGLAERGGRCPHFERDPCACTLRRLPHSEGAPAPTATPGSIHCLFFDPERMWC